MPPQTPDAAYLWDMLKAAREVEKIVRGLSRDEYLKDRIRQLALERAIEVLGEAARQVSDERIWEVARVHVPALIAQLAPLVPPPPPPLEG